VTRHSMARSTDASAAGQVLSGSLFALFRSVVFFRLDHLQLATKISNSEGNFEFKVSYLCGEAKTPLRLLT